MYRSWLSIQHARLRPYGAGGGLTSPRGITAARPPFFILRVGARPLGFIDFGDFKRLRCFLEPCFEFFHFSENNCRTKCFGKTLWAYAFNFFIFPKTAAGPGASEKLCGRFRRLLGLLGRSWEPLGASWDTPEGFLGPLGPSWRRSKTIQNNTKISCNNRATSRRFCITPP